jgi:hypothetical protein
MSLAIGRDDEHADRWQRSRQCAPMTSSHSQDAASSRLRFRMRIRPCLFEIDVR